jgi:hypothetical protein
MLKKNSEISEFQNQLTMKNENLFDNKSWDWESEGENP